MFRNAGFTHRNKCGDKWINRIEKEENNELLEIIKLYYDE